MSGNPRPTEALRRVMDSDDHADAEAAALLRYLQDHGGVGGWTARKKPSVFKELPVLVGWISAPDAQIPKPVPLYTL
jgi:hypothetical protein